MVGCVGEDQFGADYLSHLQSLGASVGHVKRVPGPTGTALIWVDPTGENSIVIVAGANAHVSAGQVQEAAVSSALSSSKAILMQLEVPTEALVAACKTKGDALAFLTPAPFPKAGLDAELFAHSDVLLPNRGEAQKMYASLGGSSADPTPQECAELILSKGGCSAVVVTLGGDGCYVAVKEAAGVAAEKIPAAKVEKVIDTTGAGDAFAGSLAYFYSQLVEKKGSASTRVDAASLFEAARRATAVAAYSVARKGAQSSYPKRADLDGDLFRF